MCESRYVPQYRVRIFMGIKVKKCFKYHNSMVLVDKVTDVTLWPLVIVLGPVLPVI
jgi:hypothetical protein